jgi:WD40 repeat protein
MASPMTFAFDAYVTAALFDARGDAWFGLGDGTVRAEDGAAHEAHTNSAVLSAAVHPSGEGIVTGGDDGRVVWTRATGATQIAEVKGRWIDSLASSPASGLIAFAAGKDLHIRGDKGLERVFQHERTVSHVAFEPKGLRVAAATYNGAAVWYARIADQKPTFLKWAGSHIGVLFSPDGKFLMSSMQENQLHGWRVADAHDLRMGGYPAKVKSMTFFASGMLMATSGAQGAVVWPFGGNTGPMNKQAAEIGFDDTTMVGLVAAAPKAFVLAGGTEDGRIWAADVRHSKLVYLKEEKGPPITALAVSDDAARLAWGDEDGGAGVVDLPPLG